MICPKCGATLREDALFCQKCGEKIVEVKTEAPVQATPAPVMAAPEMRKEAPTEIPAPKKTKWSWKKKILVSIVTIVVLIVVSLGTIIALNKKEVADYLLYDMSHFILDNYDIRLSEDEEWTLVKMSAWLGNPIACDRVSNAYLYGRDYVAKDVEKAMYWHEKYIIYGEYALNHYKNLPSGARELELALAYETGRYANNSIPKNSPKALEWYQIAADKGNEVAKSIIRAGSLTTYLSQLGVESINPYDLAIYLPESTEQNLSKDEALRRLYITGSLQEIKVAIQNGADVNAKLDANGTTPLMIAAQSNTDPNVIAALVKAGADMNVEDLDGWTPLSVSNYNSNPLISNTILDLMKAASSSTGQASGSSSVPVQISDEEFERICGTGSPQEVAAAIQNGANVNARLDADETYAEGTTPLMVAAHSNTDPDVITALVRAGADINAQNGDGWTPLIYSAYNRNPNIITTLLDLGADATIKEFSEGKTAFDHANELQLMGGEMPLGYANALEQLSASSSSSSAEMPETSDLQYAIITGNNVNVRSAPNTSGRVLFQVSQSNNDYLVIEKTPTQDGSGGNWYRVVYRWLEYEESGGDYDSVDEPTYINGNFFRAQPLPVEDRDMYMLFSEREREARQASYR